MDCISRLWKKKISDILSIFWVCTPHLSCTCELVQLSPYLAQSAPLPVQCQQRGTTLQWYTYLTGSACSLTTAWPFWDWLTPGRALSFVVATLAQVYFIAVQTSSWLQPFLGHGGWKALLSLFLWHMSCLKPSALRARLDAQDEHTPLMPGDSCRDLSNSLLSLYTFLLFPARLFECLTLLFRFLLPS